MQHPSSAGCLGARRREESALVRIEILVDTFDPPEGTLVADDGESIPFAGWLDLLRVLSELLEVRRP
jgi:hypothetical protein